MRKIALSISEIKDIEKREFLRLGDSFKLMEQAGEACAKQIIKIYKKNRFIVVCGPGNNGGDGLILSTCLSEHGKEVDLYCLGKNSYKGDSLKAYKKNKLKKKSLDELNVNQDAVIVDALFGIGLNKKIEGYDEILQTHELKTLEKNKYAKEIGVILKSLKLSKSIKSNKTVSFRVLAQIASAVPKRVKFKY